MKWLLLLALVTFFIVTIVMAVVFRDPKAKGRLRFVAKVGWAYVIAIVALAAWRLYAGG